MQRTAPGLEEGQHLVQVLQRAQPGSGIVVVAGMSKARIALFATRCQRHDLVAAFGPAGRPDMSLFRFVQWIVEGRPVTVFGDGRQERDFTFVDDVARGTIAALKPVGYEIVNLGNDEPVVLMDAIRLVEDLTGCQANIEYRPMHKADVLATWANISKAQELLGWRPRNDFAQGVRQLVDWYQANRDWAKDIRTD